MFFSRRSETPQDGMLKLFMAGAAVALSGIAVDRTLKACNVGNVRDLLSMGVQVHASLKGLTVPPPRGEAPVEESNPSLYMPPPPSMAEIPPPADVGAYPGAVAQSLDEQEVSKMEETWNAAQEAAMRNNPFINSDWQNV